MSKVSPLKALELLKNEEVVAIPTETVYGLAGVIDSTRALEKIFSTKKRPFFDPLIIHVKDIDQSEELAHWDSVSKTLAETLWPGPITFVLPKKEKVSDLITSGGSTVGIRSPSHPLAQDLLKNLGKPFAAPSANRFGRTSPTSSEHVLEEFETEIPVLDGGPCEKGIESTVVQVSEEEKKVFILRPGVITKSEIESLLKANSLPCTVEYKVQDNSPGHLKNHYQPTVNLILFEEGKDLKGEITLESGEKVSPWHLPNSPELAARSLYADLRIFSSRKKPIYLVIQQEWKNSTHWQAILDRVYKACHFYGHVENNGKIRLSPKA